MRVVIDTNVLVSAALKDGTPEAVILFVVGRSDIEWVASPQILTEYFDVLARPRFKLLDAERQAWQDLLRETVTRVEASSSVEFTRDPKDAKFIVCALDTGADYLITGDRDLDDARKMLDTTIITAAEFKRLFMDAH